LARFGSGEKHQEKQAEPVDEVQRVALMAGGFGQGGSDAEPAEQSGSEDNSGEDFSNHLWLAEFNEEAAEQVSHAHEKQEKEEKGREIGVGHSGDGQ